MRWKKLNKPGEIYVGVRAAVHAKRNGGLFLRNPCRIGTGPGNVRLGVAVPLIRPAVESAAVKET